MVDRTPACVHVGSELAVLLMFLGARLDSHGAKRSRKAAPPPRAAQLRQHQVHVPPSARSVARFLPSCVTSRSSWMILAAGLMLEPKPTWKSSGVPMTRTRSVERSAFAGQAQRPADDPPAGTPRPMPLQTTGMLSPGQTIERRCRPIPVRLRAGEDHRFVRGSAKQPPPPVCSAPPGCAARAAALGERPARWHRPAPSGCQTAARGTPGPAPRPPPDGSRSGPARAGGADRWPWRTTSVIDRIIGSCSISQRPAPRRANLRRATEHDERRLRLEGVGDPVTASVTPGPAVTSAHAVRRVRRA